MIKINAGLTPGPICLLLLAFLSCASGSAQNVPILTPPSIPISDSVNKQSFTYAIKDTQSLGLDIYSLKGLDTLVKHPCILFVFGGAFMGGERNDSIYNLYFNSLAKSHYIVVSMSYRLGLRGVTNISKFNIEPLRRAVDMAVDDVYDCTHWIISHAGQTGIDTSKIILSGSSSGAITVLTAEFERKNEYPVSDKLPAGFQYAAVVSFSGAILSFDGSLKYKHLPAPKMMFHGSADKIVPYNKIRFFNKGFYGSAWIAKISKENNYPYFFYSEEGLGHEVSVLPMFYNIPEILGFIDKYVIQKKPYQIEEYFKDPDQKPLMLLTPEELMKKLNHSPGSD